jgi:hypothetical protein
MTQEENTMAKEITWSEYAGYEVGEKPTVLILSEEQKQALTCLLDRIIETLQENILQGTQLDPLDAELVTMMLLSGWLRDLRCWLTLDVE